MAVRKGGESSASSLISGEEAPSMAAAAAPALVGGGTGPESFRRQPHVSPSFTAVISPTIARVPRSETAPSGGPKGSDVGAACAGVDEVAGGGSGSSVAPASEGEASSSGCSSGSCDACNSVLSIATPTFCCRVCSKLFHSECVGYNTFAKRQSPPPDWICPRCPNGERGPSEGIHRSLKGDGVVKQQRGNQPWCPICLGDDRVPGTGKMGRSSKTKCRGCGLRTHDHCLPKHEIGPDGRWPCNECQRRRDGVVPGNNPVWLRLKEARLDGGWDVSVVPDAAATSAQSAVQGTGAAAAPSLDQTKGLDHHEPGSNSADRRGTPEVNRSRRSITPGRRASSDSTTSCCKAPATPKRPAFCCRVCRKLFHGVCAGYNSKKRQVPPPDWICPHCPNGERGPSETIHRSLKGKGVVNQKLGNMPWCPICLSDNRISGKKEIGDIERCPGCGFHTHAHCLAGLQVWQDGRWPCDECDRRRHGVVPGNNPDWLRLRAARLDGGRKPTWTHLPPAVETACATPPAAATADSPHSDVASCLEDSARPSANEQAETETAAGLCESIKGRPSLHHHLDHVQIQRSHDTVLGSHEMAATGAVGGVLPAAAAEAATERAVFHCPPAGSPFSDQMQFFDGLAPSSAVTLAVREAARAAEAAAADAPAPRDSLLGLAPSSGRVLAAPGTTPPPKPAESCAQSVGSPDLDHMLFLGSLGLPRANPAGTPAALAATPAAGARTPAGVPSKAVGATASLPPHSDSTEALEARRAAPPGVAESCRLVFGVPNIQEVFLASGLAQSSADASAATTPSALRAIDPYNSTAGTTSPSDHQHQPEPNDSTSSGGQETTAVTETTAETGSEEAEGGAEGKEMEPEQTFPSPRPAEESSRGASSDGSDNSTHNSCEVCNKVFIPSLRPTFSCRACRKLFHGDCAGYARHKRQCPPPDWICPRCPNGERGPTEYDIHSSLRGRGTVSQTLGNQLWCPICLGDDRARGSTKNDTDGKKCPDCGLRVHGHCVSGLEAGPDGRWPCDECLRRRNGVTPGNNPLWLRLKAARLDGGPTVANIGVTLSPAGAVVSAAASTGSPLSRGGSSCGSVERRAYSRQAAAAGAVRPLVANASSPSPDSSQASSLGGPLTSSGDSAGVPTTAPSTCSPSPPSPSRQPVLPLALPASHSSPASSPGEAMQLSAPASSNAQATPSRADTTEHSDIIGDVSTPRCVLNCQRLLGNCESAAAFASVFLWYFRGEWVMGFRTAEILQQ